MTTDLLTHGSVDVFTEIELERARGDCNAFAEWVLKDKEGARITQAAIHRLIQDFFDWTIENDLHACVLAPWGHGKTEQTAIARALHLLGRNRNLRGKVVCNTDDAACDRTLSVRRYIEHDEDLHRVFPDLKLGGEQGSTSKITVERDGRGKDPSLQAFGILASSIGTRADYLICDDVVDINNALRKPIQREQVKQAFYQGFLSRLEPDGWCAYIATVWHKQDLTMELLEKARQGKGKFAALVLAVSEDLTRITVETANADGFIAPRHLPLWGRRTKEWLEGERETLGPRGFARGYHQRPFSDEDALFREAWFYEGPGRPRFTLTESAHDPALYTCSMGVDPAISKRSRADFFSLSVVGVPLEKRDEIWMLDLFRRRGLSVFAQADQIIDLWTRWRPHVVHLETIAYQEALRQVLEKRCAELGIFMNVQPVPAHVQRKDERFGGWSAFVESGRFKVDPERFPAFVSEALAYPADHDDTLDSTDLAIRGALVPAPVTAGMDDDEPVRDNGRRFGFSDRGGRASKFGFSDSGGRSWGFGFGGGR